MRNYIITGGAGFIGSSLAKKLVKDGHKVFILDDLSTGSERNVPDEAIFYKVDVSDTEKLYTLKFPEDINAIFHIAGQSSGEASFDNPIRDIDVNYKATYNMLHLCKFINCKRFIYTSSMSVYGDVNSQIISEDYPCNPVSYYGVNKFASEKLIKVFVRNTEIKETIFRLFNVYGPGQNMDNMKQGMVSIYLSYLRYNKPIHVKGSLDRYRDFVYIDDVIDMFIFSESCEKSYGEIFNLGTGVKTIVEDLLKTILRIYEKENFNQWVYVQGNTSGDIKGCIANIDKLRKACNWKPGYDLENGLCYMKEWLDKSYIGE